MDKRRRRRVVGVVLMLLAALGVIFTHPESYQSVFDVAPPQLPTAVPDSSQTAIVPARAVDALAQLEIKGRAPKTGYKRTEFGDGWQRIGGCDMRNIILARDLAGEEINDDCKVLNGDLIDPYTGKKIQFQRGPDTSDDVQIDHVVALSDAWQKGAQQLDAARREELANDPLELLAVDGSANQAKADSDVASWLPPNKSFRCQYVARQIAVKYKYSLWVTSAEHDAMARVLDKCPNELLPVATPSKTSQDIT